MTLRTCADCMYWRAPHAQSKNVKSPSYGQCGELVVHPRTRHVMPESQVEPEQLWDAEPFRTTVEFNACKGWAPRDNTATKPELVVLKGGVK